MTVSIFIHSLNQFSVVLLRVLLMTLIKSVLLFSIVALLIRVFNVTSVRTKYVLWVCYMFSTILIAIYTMASPAFSIPVLQISPHRVKEHMILSHLLYPPQESLTTANTYTIQYSNYVLEELNLSSEPLHWTFWIVCGWVAGAVLSLFYTLTGRIGVKYISRNASQHKVAYFKEEVSCLAQNLGITREVKVIISNRCRVPFTYNISHPVLVIPYEAIDWPILKLRAILKHELSHIQRHDYLVLSLSRCIYSVFWFIPAMWIAYIYLQLEQEKICDSAAIEEGEPPTAYARYMIDLARTTRSLIFWSGNYMLKRRNNMLEKRVTNILEIKQSSKQKRVQFEKSFLLTIFILLTAILIIAGSCVTRQKVLSSDEFLKTYSGTWMNIDYSGVEWEFQKLIINSDGMWETYATDIVKQRSCHGNTILIDCWTDSDGVRWYRVYKDLGYLCGSDRLYEYGKITNSGNTLEYIFRLGPNEIKKWEPDNPDYEYRIFYRQ